MNVTFQPQLCIVGVGIALCGPRVKQTKSNATILRPDLSRNPEILNVKPRNILCPPTRVIIVFAQHQFRAGSVLIIENTEVVDLCASKNFTCLDIKRWGKYFIRLSIIILPILYIYKLGFYDYCRIPHHIFRNFLSNQSFSFGPLVLMPWSIPCVHVPRGLPLIQLFEDKY